MTDPNHTYDVEDAWGPTRETYEARIAELEKQLAGSEADVVALQTRRDELEKETRAMQEAMNTMAIELQNKMLRVDELRMLLSLCLPTLTAHSADTDLLRAVREAVGQ